MHLNVGRRWKAFQAHYRQLLEQVNVFTLPHHGSEHNFTPQLPHAVPNALQFVAAAGRNSYGHPSDSVTRAIHASGKEFVRVSEKAKTALEWRHER
jgi:beta-lactamase superfamily II metal-dependent hydrolase